MGVEPIHRSCQPQVNPAEIPRVEGNIPVRDKNGKLLTHYSIIIPCGNIIPLVYGYL